MDRKDSRASDHKIPILSWNCPKLPRGTCRLQSGVSIQLSVGNKFLQNFDPLVGSVEDYLHHLVSLLLASASFNVHSQK